MVNFGLNSASILGIFLAVGGAGLYFMRSIRPELSRDHDIFFAAVGLLCGLILLFQGWRLDPILQFGQFLLTGAAVFFAVETVRLRGLTTEQARRNSPLVDERPVSREYRAELEQLEPYDYEPEEPYETNNRRLRGYEDPRPNRSSSYSDETPRPSRNTAKRPNDATGKRKRPSKPSEAAGAPSSYDDWSDANVTSERPPTRRRRPSAESTTETTPKKRRPRPPIMDDEPFKGEYVDYQPINDSSDDGEDWDKPASGRDDNQDRFDY
ncbi:MAG: hypothetical protein N5P05_000786 [Chroococcopsis gigantea SAG 12.99]|jgi:hypothetical protein|nr:hypothetical protein [Chlorogloea purpurea SAG 13.99]MDV2999180.1 hypothetical protein [Chroococcopsis gigantea SAG 12.99]